MNHASSAPRDRARPFGVGGTPLLELRGPRRLSPRVRVLAKAEWLNPGGSVKDRPAAFMIRRALEEGRLRPGRILLDASSGNTGIAYARICAALRLPVRLCLPESANEERKRLLRALGAEIVPTDPLEGSDGAIRKARELAERDPELYCYLDQYSNPENPRAHRETTGPEILEAAGGPLTHFVAGLGTGGTFRGAGSFLRERVPGVRLLSVQPDAAFHGLEGLKHMASAIVPEVHDPALADEELFVATEDGQREAVRLAREEGILTGPSGGAAAAAALRLAARLSEEGRSATVVTVLPDGGERYLSERFWREGAA